MSLVCFRWGNDELRVERSAIEGLESLKAQLEVDSWRLENDVVEDDGNTETEAKSVLQRPLCRK